MESQAFILFVCICVPGGVGLQGLMILFSFLNYSLPLLSVLFCGRHVGVDLFLYFKMKGSYRPYKFIQCADLQDK